MRAKPDVVKLAKAKLRERYGIDADDVVSGRLPAASNGNGQRPHIPPAHSTARTLREWLSSPHILRPQAIVIPRLAVEGRVTLLSGREKIGKSTLVGDAIADASQGRDVLGSAMIGPVRTLWYAIDEHVADAVRRFDALGADLDHIVINDHPRTIGELITALELDLAAHPNIPVVVLDTLSRTLAASGIDPNSAREVEPVLARLVDFFHRVNVSAILLYHTGKSGNEYRGSTAIGATVDEILTLRRRGKSDEDDFDDDSSDDGRRLLVQEGRSLRGRVHLTYANGCYRLYDDAEPPRLKILDTLRGHGAVSGRAQLAKLAGVRKETGLKVIAALLEEGAVIERGNRLTLAVPAVSSPPVSIAPVPASGTAASNGGSQSSLRFPEHGTVSEPTTGTDGDASLRLGSQGGNPHPAEMGTASRLRQLELPTPHLQPLGPNDADELFT